MSDCFDKSYESKRNIAETILKNMVEIQPGEFIMGAPKGRYKYCPNGILMSLLYLQRHNGN